MIMYVLLSKKLTGYIEVGFDKRTGLICYFRICIYQITVDAHRYMLEHSLQYWLSKDLFLEWCSVNGYEAVHYQEDLSFQRFWDTYGVARNRIQAEKLWDKMKVGDKAYVFMNLKAYKRYVAREQHWYRQMYPDTYLRGHWLDDWDKLKSNEHARKQAV